jgi:hypothetical protein
LRLSNGRQKNPRDAVALIASKGQGAARNFVVYNLPKRGSLILVSGYNVLICARVRIALFRWQELEVKSRILVIQRLSSRGARNAEKRASPSFCVTSLQTSTAGDSLLDIDNLASSLGRAHEINDAAVMAARYHYRTAAAETSFSTIQSLE